MKRTSLIATILTVLLFVLFAGCEKDYSYEHGGTLQPNRRCISCSYLPICDSSTFVYVDSTPTLVDTSRASALILNDTIVKGLSYTKVAGYATFGQGLYYNCAGGDYRMLFSLSGLGINLDSLVQALLQNIQLPIPIPPSLIQVPDKITTSVLKTSLPVGGAWTDTLYSLSFPPFLSVFAGIDYKILEKGVSRVVLGRTYTNVIHVQAKIKTVLPAGITFPLNYQMDYYFSQDVGLIEAEAKNGPTLLRNSRLYYYHL